MFRCALLALCLAALPACLGDYAFTTTYSPGAPPVPYDEYVSPPPASGYVWVPGHWWWDGFDWVWIRGRWSVPPGDGYVWVRSGWVLQGDRYVYYHGRWAPPAHRSTVVYVHPPPRVRVQAGATYRTAPRRTTVRGSVRTNR